VCGHVVISKRKLTKDVLCSWIGDATSSDATSKSKILIQTRLDVDDGMAINLLDHLQNNAVNFLQHNGREASGWMLQCVGLYVEWHYDMKNETEDPNGWIRMENAPPFCVTPGLTLAVAPGAANWTGRSPMYPHDRIKQKLSDM
jgi:hypothetical protein